MQSKILFNKNLHNISLFTKRGIVNKPLHNFLDELIVQKAKVAIIPQEFQTSLFNGIAFNAKWQRYSRVGALVSYPSLATASILSGNIPLGMFFLTYLPFCLILHHLALLRASMAIGELIQRQQLFNDKEANLQLNQWISENDITHMSFDNQSRLMLFSKNNFTSLTNVEWIDHTKISNKFPNIQPFIQPKPCASGQLKNTINYYHLTDEVRIQITELIKARSKRFRYLVFMGSMGGILMSVNPITVPNGIYGGLCVGIMSNFSIKTVPEDAKKLEEIINKYKNIQELIAPEYRNLYEHLQYKKEGCKIVVNIFGDLCIDPKFNLRRSFFMDNKGLENNNDDVKPIDQISCK